MTDTSTVYATDLYVAEVSPAGATVKSPVLLISHSPGSSDPVMFYSPRYGFRTLDDLRARGLTVMTYNEINVVDYTSDTEKLHVTWEILPRDQP